MELTLTLCLHREYNVFIQTDYSFGGGLGGRSGELNPLPHHKLPLGPPRGHGGRKQPLVCIDWWTLVP